MEEGAAAGGGAGTVAVPFERGSVHLVPLDGKGEAVRLVWKQGDKTRGRPVAAGTYRLANYQIEREVGGKGWLASATSPSGPEVTVRAGEETTIAISQRVKIEWNAHLEYGLYGLSFDFLGHEGMSLSIFDTSLPGPDTRVAATYQLCEAAGAVVSSGSLTYG